MRRLYSLLTIAAVGAIASCSSEKLLTRPRPLPTVESVAGTYHAEVLWKVTRNGRTDYLSNGSHVDVTLGADRSLTGDILIKGAAPGGGDLSADLTGFWHLDGRYTRLDPIVVTFLQDVRFDFIDRPVQLVGAYQVPDGYLHIWLTRE
jgi:hypothetical protein